jgi:4-diphosphocytidyl-2-C-methyl-D-erythritol kinase
MTYKSYAKINLGLEVLYKRTDGYHEINTLFHQICLADIIDIEPHNSIKINCIPDLGIQQEQNLAFKACKLLQNNYDCKLKGAEIKIKKNIPTGAGLGGGSSNASTVLKGLNSMWNLNLSDTTLLDLAKELGSDVPFFIKGGTAIGKGRGEVLEFVDFKLPYHILLIFPEVKISTKVAYEKLNRSSEISSGSDFKKILDDIADSIKLTQF